MGTQYAPLVLLQLVAAHTTRIRLATLVLDNDFRHPAVLAKVAATLDVLSGGRVELGLGAGWLADDYQQSGIPLSSGATRLARLEEAVAALTVLFDDAPASLAGRFSTLRELDGRMRPLQRPHPPVLLGGTRPRLLRFAARAADSVSFDSGPLPSSWRADALLRQGRGRPHGSRGAPASAVGPHGAAGGLSGPWTASWPGRATGTWSTARRRPSRSS